MNSIIKPVNQDVISISAVLTWLLSVILIIIFFFDFLVKVGLRNG